MSIIIPVYNAAPYLRQCLDSLLAQSASDWEAILVDDASEDDSLLIAEQYAEQDARFRILKQPTRRGQSAARNRGLAEATGDYIAFLDSDDWWHSNNLSQHLAAIGGYDLVQSGYQRVRDGRVIEKRLPKHRWQFTSACMRLYRRSAIEGLRFQEGTYYEDVLWTVDLLIRHPKVRICHYIGYNYRLNPQSTTSGIHRKDKRYVLDELRKRGWKPVVLFTRLRLALYFRKQHL